MRIIDKRHDYYDYASVWHDESVVFDRKKEVSNDGSSDIYGYFPVVEKYEKHPFYRNRQSIVRSVQAWMCVCGKYFPLQEVERVTKSPIYDYGRFYTPTDTKLVYYKKPTEEEAKIISSLVGVHDSLITLHKRLNTPIFMMYNISNSRKHAIVSNFIPVLSEHGFTNDVYDAKQLYQDIEYFIRNVLTVSPDTMPKIVMTDPEKITSHGFDLKSSFRHPVR